MKCPICQTTLEFSGEGLEEFYYDCSHCDSSLFFKNGNCEVLNKGDPSKTGNKKTFKPKKMAKQEESLAPDLTNHSDKKKKQEESNFLSQNLSKKPGTDNSSGEDQADPLKKDLSPAEEEDPVNDSKALAENKSQQEEEFFPDETTQVPELGRAEEDLQFKEENQNPEKPSEFSSSVPQTPSSSQTPSSPRQRESKENQSPEKPLESLVENTADPSERPKQETEGGEDFQFEPDGDPVSKDSSSVEQSEKENFSEVAEFGSSTDQDKQSPFLYDLTLNEINSQIVREKVLSVLEDESLALSSGDSENLMPNRIKDGKITLSKISPVQAYVIVTSLMGLPLNISWEQSHIAES